MLTQLVLNHLRYFNVDQIEGVIHIVSCSHQQSPPIAIPNTYSYNCIIPPIDCNLYVSLESVVSKDIHKEKLFSPFSSNLIHIIWTNREKK